MTNEEKQFSFPNGSEDLTNKLIEITINGKTLRGAMNRIFDYIKNEYK